MVRSASRTHKNRGGGGSKSRSLKRRECYEKCDMEHSDLRTRFANILMEMSKFHDMRGEPFKSRAYKSSSQAIKAHVGEIKSVADVKGIPKVGPSSIKILEEYLETGKVSVLSPTQDKPEVTFMRIHGIGAVKAKSLVEAGITTIEELRERQAEVLNNVQRKGLKYYEETMQRIPRAEIDEFKAVFDAHFPFGASRYEIVGSYRRGAETSGDIDIIITDAGNDASCMGVFVDALINRGILVEILSRGERKVLAVGRVGEGGVARRIDFMYSTPDEWAFSILYFTGSADFNVAMRHHAMLRGYTMNEHRIESVADGMRPDVVFADERDVFKFLGLEYKAPMERVNASSVVVSVEPVKTKTIKLKRPKLSMFEEFKKSGMRYLETLTEANLEEMIRGANDAYYNGEGAVLTDSEYDILKEYMERKYPSNPLIAEVGAKVERKKVTLPYFMGSMNKIKPDTNSVVSWCAKYGGVYVVSCKLDGVSALYTSIGGKTNLYTRGDGKVGQDISHLIPYLRGVPAMGGKDDVVVRGELIIPRAIFADKYAKTMPNARNMVSGLVIAKTLNLPRIRDIRFVAYEVIEPALPIAEQLSYIQRVMPSMSVVKYETHSSISNEKLSQILQDWRQSYDYDMDGIIVYDSSRAHKHAEDGNPDYAFAFKMVLTDQVAEVKVVDVLWSSSKDGYLKPRIRIEPVVLSGVTIEYATAFNASYVETNRIGVGAIIEIVRSGDVIPHIMRVVQPAETALMPADVKWHWNDTRVDIVLDEADDEMRLKLLTAFFVGIGVERLSSGNVKKMVDGGYDTIEKIVKMTMTDYLSLDGFKERLSTIIYENMRTALDNATLVQYMASSNIFGRGVGERKLKPIMDAYKFDELTVDKVAGVKGWSRKSAEEFMRHVDEFRQFMVSIGREGKIRPKSAEKVKPKVESELNGKTVVMTGFRDKEMEEYIVSLGGTIGSSVSKNTYMVIAADLEDNSGKMKKARELNIRIMEKEEFKSWYY